MIHLMIDFETLDVKPTAHLLSVGLVWFDKYGINDTEYFEFNDDQLGRTISADTCRWWQKQSVTMPDGCDNLQSFVDAFWGYNYNYLWSCGKLDVDILENIGAPFDYWKVRDVRTLRDFVNPPIEFKGKQHNALDDCLHQVKIVQEFLK